MCAPVQVFEGKLVEGDLKSGGHLLQAVSGSGAGKVVYNYSTDRVVGNGSFGVVFMATCLESGETVSRRHSPCMHIRARCVQACMALGRTSFFFCAAAVRKIAQPYRCPPQ